MAANEQFDWTGISKRLTELAPNVLGQFPSYISTEIDDIVQDTLLKLYRSRFSEQPSSRLLVVILRHVAIDRMRARRRVQSLHDLDVSEAIMEAPTEVDRRTQLWERLQTSLACLSGEDRAILMRFYLNEIPITQLAKEYDIKYSAMAVRLHRIKAKLRDELCRLESH